MYSINSNLIYDSSTSTSTTITNPYTYNYDELMVDLNKIKEKYNKEKKENMNNLFKGFEFGSCEHDNVKMSFYGIAVKNASGTYVSYDAKTSKIFDVDVLNFNAKFLYKMPVAIKDVLPGDVVIHNRKPVFVTSIEDNKITAIDPAAGEEKSILLTHSPFGFDFVTKVINIFGNFNTTASADQPFGNILPLIALSDEDCSDNLLPLMLMNGNSANMNPMMFYLLAKDNNNDILPLLFFMNNGNFNLPSVGTN